MDKVCGFIDQLVSRFEHYAANLKGIEHSSEDRLTKRFMHIDLDGLHEAVTNGVGFPALYLQTPEVDKDGSYDNLNEQYNLTFIVVINDKTISKAQAYNRAKTFTDKIYNRVLTDVNEGLIPGVISGTSEGPFGPMADSLLGWGVSFNISDAYNGEVDPKDWRDLS